MNNDTLQKDFSLKAYNTFGIDVKTKYFLPYSKVETLEKFLPEINEFQLKPLMVGEGSNLLFTQDYGGIVLFSQIQFIKKIKENDQSVWIEAGAGLIWDNLVAWAVDHNYGGIENLSAIPGTVGASPVQNIGAYGVEAKDSIIEVNAIEISTGEKKTFSNEECTFDYRFSIFKGELKDQFIVTSVVYKLSKAPQFNLSYGNIQELLGEQTPSLSLIRQVITEVRDSKLPNHKELGNAGSFFTNPYISTEAYEAFQKQYPSMPGYKTSEGKVKVPAGWLIDHAGLKGYKHNKAAVHDKQALVLVNTGDATGQDIIELALYIIEKVKSLYNIELTPEVNII